MASQAANGQDPNDPNNQPNLGGSGTITGGASSPTGGAGGSAYQAPAASRGNPSNTPNIQDYLSANQGAGQQLSGAISGNVQNQANKIQNQYNTSQQQLGSMYDPINQNLQKGQSATNTAFQNPQDLLAAYQASQAQANPAAGTTPAAPDANNLAAYNQFQGNVAGTQQYNQNQQQIQNYGQAGQQAVNTTQSQLGGLQQTAGMGANQMGQNQLLQQTVGTPNYSTGQKTLDSLFLSGQSNQLNQNLNDIYKNTAQNTQAAPGEDYQSKLAALNQLSGQNTAYAQNLFLNGPQSGGPSGAGLNQIAGNAQNEYNAAVAANAAPTTANGTNVSSLQQAAALNNGQGRFSNEQLSALGLTPGTQAWGVGLGGDITQNSLNAYNAGGAAQTATADEIARYSALNQLAGGPTNTNQNLFNGATTGGGYKPVNFDSAGFSTAVGNASKAVNQTDFSSMLTGLMPSLYQDPREQAFVQQLQQGIASGIMNPETAQQLSLQHTQDISLGGSQQGNMGDISATVGGYNTGQAIQDYYNNKYKPLAGDVLGDNLGQNNGGIRRMPT